MSDFEDDFDDDFDFDFGEYFYVEDTYDVVVSRPALCCNRINYNPKHAHCASLLARLSAWGNIVTRTPPFLCLTNIL